MIARGLSSGTICFGCRLRLLRQVNRPNLSQSINQSQSTNRSSAVAWPHTRRWFANEASAQPDDSEKEQKQHPNDWDSLEKASDEQYRNFLHQQDTFPDFDDTHDVAPKRTRREKTKEKYRTRKIERVINEDENSTSWKHLDLKKRRLSGKKVLTETSASLGSDMLGKPAYAIVMRDTRDYRAKKRTVEVEKNDEKREELDIQALLDNQLEPPTDAEVRENINELRPPKTERILKEKEFRRIQQELEDGFLNAQLVSYIAKFKPEPTEQHSSQQTGIDSDFIHYPWAQKVTPWMPLDAHGRPPATDDPLARHFHAYLPENASPKSRAAILLMRQCWNLQIEELANGLGEMAVALDARQFMPLMRRSQRPLQRIMRDYLEEGEALETHVHGKQIRILAPKYKCQTILTEINALIQRIEAHTFPISYVTSDPAQITPRLLEEVGHITNTYVRQTKTGNRLTVSWLQTGKLEEPNVENLSHVVFRFLRAALQPEPVKHTFYIADAERAVTSGNGRLVVDHTNREKWAWKDKLQQWSRFVAPISAEDAEKSSLVEAAVTELPKLSLEIGAAQTQQRPVHVPYQVLQNNIPWKDEASAEDASSTPLPEGVEVLDSNSSRFPYQPVRWSSDLSTNTSAKFGHILTPYSKNARTNTHDLTSRPCNFSPVVPHPVTLTKLSLLNENKILPTTSTILIRFLHNPASAARALPLVAPSLELRLSLSEPTHAEETPKITGVHSLRAVTDTHHHEIPLPASPVDLRITQTQSATLQGSLSALSAWQPIADFLARSHLDISAGKLKMSAQQRFQIPLRLFNKVPMTKEVEMRKQQHLQQSPQEEDNIKEEAEIPTQTQNEEDPNFLRSTLYEFAGLELHRSVTVPYSADMRFSLTYLSIEAGQGGGRRAELSLRPVPFSSSASGVVTSESSNNLQDDYVRACYEFARTAEHWFDTTVA